MENKKNWAPHISLGVGMASTILIGYGIVAGWVFPSTIEYRVAIEILRDIIQVDGVLIGFVGLVTTLAVTELSKVSADLAKPEVILPKEKGGMEQIGAILIGIDTVMKREWSTVMAAGVAVILFVSSILSSLIAMSNLRIFDYAEPRTFLLPICSLIMGIVGTFLILVFSVMRANP